MRLLECNEFIPLDVGKWRLRGEPVLSFGSHSLGQKSDFTGHGISRRAMPYRDQALSGDTSIIRFNQTFETRAFLSASGGKNGRGEALSTGLTAILLDTLKLLSVKKMTVSDRTRGAQRRQSDLSY